MSYADGLLSTGERIRLPRTSSIRSSSSGAPATRSSRSSSRSSLLWLGGNLDPDGFSGTVRELLGWVTAVLFVGGIAVVVWTALRYINQEYVLTNRRVIQVEGVLNRNATDSSLEKINDAVLSQSVFGRMFGFGDLTVLTASESGIEQMRMLRSPIVFKKAMLDAKHELRGRHGARRLGAEPADPRRLDRRAGARRAARGHDGDARRRPRAAAAAPAPALRADPDEVTRTLASLADLRDRGAITPEEYERKKADLLTRL